MERYIGKLEHLLTIMKRRFIRVIRWKGSTVDTILQGRTDGSRKIGRPARSWTGNMKEWDGLRFNTIVRTAEGTSVENLRAKIQCSLTLTL